MLDTGEADIDALLEIELLDKSVADSVALTLGDAVATSEEDIAALLDDDIVIDSVIENVLLPLIDTEDEVDDEGFDEAVAV